jgi:hypothetical protein
MTFVDIERVEQSLSLKLPAEYRQLLVDYPFSNDSFATDCMVIRDADALINANRGPNSHFMIHHRKGRWAPQKNHFLIGSDGGEEQYYLDLNDPQCRVLKFDLETGELSPYANGIAEYKAKVYEVDREVEEDEKRAAERRRNARWWEFWKKL